MNVKKTRRTLALAMASAVAFVGFGMTAPSAMAWLAQGPLYQYPSAGGTWQYGFWDIQVRSYYTVNRCHGSTVQYNSSTERSANTASGRTSIADLYAVNAYGNDDRYWYRTC